MPIFLKSKTTMKNGTCSKPLTATISEQRVEKSTTENIEMMQLILDRNIKSSHFNIDQLNVGREAFVNMLTASLAKAENAGDAIEVDG